MKIQKKKFGGGGRGGGSGEVSVGGGQGDRRIEVLWKIHKKRNWRGVGGVESGGGGSGCWGSGWM